MTISIEPYKEMKVHRAKFYRKGTAAYTLVEMIVVTGVSAVVVASTVMTFMVFAVGSSSIGAYTSMSKDSRIALEYFARDMRAAEDVTIATESKLRVIFPSTSYYNGSTVTYDYYADAKLLFRIEKDNAGVEVSNKLVLEGVEQFVFSYFDPLGDPIDLNTPSILLSVKSVQVDAEMLRDVSRTEATDYIISARFMMRNRPVTD